MVREVRAPGQAKDQAGIAAAVAEFLRSGGAITQLDSCGRVIDSSVADMPRSPGAMPSVAALDGSPAVIAAPSVLDPPVMVEVEASGIGEELRAIRREARAIARRLEHMTSRRAGTAYLTELLEAWARWVEQPIHCRCGGGGTLLARWMEAKGHLIFGGGHAGVPLDTVEERIEDAVREMGNANRLQEDVLRLEYTAGWREVVERRGLHGYDPRGVSQLQKAVHLGIGLRTYERRLSEARALVAERLRRKV